MADVIMEFSKDSVDAAIEVVARESARQTGRNIEWLRRRLRDAVKFTSAHGRDHRDYAAHWALAKPVLMTAADLGGFIDGKGEIN